MEKKPEEKLTGKKVAEIKILEEKAATPSWGLKTLKTKCILKYEGPCSPAHGVVLHIIIIYYY